MMCLEELTHCCVRKLDDLERIPKFALYHAGQQINDRLISNNRNIWGRISHYLYFLADREQIVQQYLKKDRNLYVIDGLYLPHGSLVVLREISLWYDKINDLEVVLDDMKKQDILRINDFLESNKDFRHLKKFLDKNDIKTKHDMLRAINQAKREWFEFYTKSFNINHYERYKRKGSVVMIPGPIKVE